MIFVLYFAKIQLLSKIIVRMTIKASIKILIIVIVKKIMCKFAFVEKLKNLWTR